MALGDYQCLPGLEVDTQSMIRKAIHQFDNFARKRGGVYEFSQDEQCVIRLSKEVTSRTLRLPENRISRGSPVMRIHLWNEHLPAIPRQGSDLAWATTAWRLFRHSLYAVADELIMKEALFPVRAVGGNTVLIDRSESCGNVGLLGRMGFTILPYQNSLGWFGDYWKNFYSWLLIWTYNPSALQNRKITKLRRYEFWMTKDEFLHRFAGPLRSSSFTAQIATREN